MTRDAQEASIEADHQKVVDPSDAVTGLGFIFGVAGAAMGVAASLILSAEYGVATLLYCFVAGLAGGSAGLVAGGLIGALFSVARGNRR